MLQCCRDQCPEAMRGKRGGQVCCLTIDHLAEDCEQEDGAHEQEALTKAKRHEDHTRRRDQAARGHVSPLPNLDRKESKSQRLRQTTMLT